MRVTNNMMSRQYSSRLNSVLENLNFANEQVSTKRKYTKAAQDPTSAVKARQLRREFADNENHLQSAKDAQSRFDAVETGMMNISKQLEDVYVDITGIVNGTYEHEDRVVVAKKLEQAQLALVQEANTRYAGQHLYGGSSAEEVPFKLEGGVVTFRGIDVNTTDPAELEKLEKMASEKIYTDLGFGLEFVDPTNPDYDINNPNTIVGGSAFNTAMPGIDFLGFGLDENGNPKNAIANLGKMAEALKSDDFSLATFDPLSKNLEDQRSKLLVSVTSLGSNSKFLDYTINRFEDTVLNLTSKIEDTEYVDPVSAIMNFKELDTTYRAALQAGMSILSVSFFDFMK